MPPRSSRLDLMLRSAREIRFDEADDLRLLDTLTESDRASLRAAAGTGAIEDRSKATVALVRLGDEAARETLAVLLAEPVGTDALVAMRFLGDAADEHRDLVTPWLLEPLGSADPTLRREAALTCGVLRVATAGPRLLELVRVARAEAAGTGGHSQEVNDLVHAAASAWPSREVADEVRRCLELRADPGGLLGIEPRPIRAVVEIARRGEPDAQDWARRWCVEWLGARAYEGSDTAAMVDALVSCGPAIVPPLDDVVRDAPPSAGVGCALKALAALDPVCAEHQARHHWARFPSVAVAVLAARYQATEARDVAELVDRIASQTLGLEGDCAEALVRIGGPDARRAAARAVERLAARDPLDPELPALTSLVAAAAPAGDIADEMVRMELAPPEAAHEAVRELSRSHPWEPWHLADIALRPDAPTLTSPYEVMLEVFERAGCLVSFDPESGFDPPPYDELLAEFVQASDGSVKVDNIELAEEPDGLRLSFGHNGLDYSFDLESNDDWYDLMSIWEMSDSLSPEREDDPRRFIQLGVGTYVFADPEKVEVFGKRFGMSLSV